MGLALSGEDHILFGAKMPYDVESRGVRSVLASAGHRIETRPLCDLSFGPDTAFMALDNALKDPEEFVIVLHVEACTVILYQIHLLSVFLKASHPDSRHWAVPAEFGVFE